MLYRMMKFLYVKKKDWKIFYVLCFGVYIVEENGGCII